MSLPEFSRTFAFLLTLIAVSPARAGIGIGDAFPPLASAGLVPLAGGELPATTGRVVLVDFWASWCAPCKASFPAMAKLHADLAARGLVIVAVGVDDKPEAAAAFVRKLAPPFPTLRDASRQLAPKVDVPAMPTSYLVGRDGRVRHIFPGFHGDRSVAELRRHLEALLAE